MKSALENQHCAPCEGGIPPLGKSEAKRLLSMAKGWELSTDAKAISRRFIFKNFKGSMKFVNAVAKIAEAEGHHPDIHVSWNKVRMDLSTHAIGGLSMNDFILAAKINRLYM